MDALVLRTATKMFPEKNQFSIFNILGALTFVKAFDSLSFLRDSITSLNMTILHL